jgi:CubicO group peptidase (beta-lactamase class C family)
MDRKEEQIKAVLVSGRQSQIFNQGAVLTNRGFRVEVPLWFEFCDEGEFFWDIASIQKNIINMAVLSLEYRGELGLNNRVSRFLPIKGKFTETLTVRDLMASACDFRLKVGEYSLGDVLTAGLKFKPGTGFQYRNSQHIILAEILREVVGHHSLKECLQSELGDYLNFDHFCFPHELENKMVVVSSPENGFLPHDPLAHWAISQLGEQEPGHAGAFATEEFLMEFGKLFLPSSENVLGQRYLSLIHQGGYQVNQKTGLWRSYGAMTRRSLFTGHKKFDQEHFFFAAFSGPSICVWPEGDLVVIIMINARYFPEGAAKDQDRSDKILALRKSVIGALVD